MGNSYLHNNKKSQENKSSTTSKSSALGAKSILPLLLSKSSITTQCDAAPLPPPPLPATGTDAPPSPPPAPPASSPEEDSISKAAQSADSMPTSSIPNPGPYEMVAHDAGKRIVALDTHDGFRCDINKQLSPYFAVVHSFWLGTSMIPDGRNKTYSFVAQVADENGLLMARMDPERGSVDGRIHMGLLGGLAMAKLQLGLSAPEPASKDAQQQGGGGQNDQALLDVDFGGLTWSGNIKYGSMGNGIMLGCNYFQGITKRLAVGGEGMYVGTNQSLMSSYSAKYTFPKLRSTPAEEESGFQSSYDSKEDNDFQGNAVLVANFSSAQGLLSVNYKRVVTPNRVTLATELQCSPMTLDSQVMVGAEVNLQRSKMNVCVDGTGRIQSTLETKLGMAPGSPTLSFAGEVDHSKNVMRFGYGLNIGG